jgi:hypothetical protein
MLVTPLPGADRGNVLEALRSVHTDVSNLHTSGLSHTAASRYAAIAQNCSTTRSSRPPRCGRKAERALLTTAREGIRGRTVLAEQTEKTGTAAAEELPLNQSRPVDEPHSLCARD